MKPMLSEHMLCESWLGNHGSTSLFIHEDTGMILMNDTDACTGNALDPV